MKKRIDLFWYFFLIIVAFVVCFMFSSTRASAEFVGGEIPGDNSGDITVNPPPIQGEELYEQCHTYITTNIISAESLSEALNGRIYADFTQEDCMEMINIASKREVIKNLLDKSSYVVTPSASGNFYGLDISNLEIGQTYTFSSNIPVGTFKIATTAYSEISIMEDNANGFTQFTFVHENKFNSTQYLFLWLFDTESYPTDITQLESYNIQIEKGSTATKYVSYDYHREYYQEGHNEGITYADNRINTESASFNNGYNTGTRDGYNQANNEGKILGDFIPSLLGGFGTFFLTLLNIDILGFNLLTVLGILITVLGIIVVIKFLKG